MSDTAVLEPQVDEVEETDEDEGVEVELNVVETGKKVRPLEFTAPAMVWGDVLTLLMEEEAASIRNAVAKDLDGVYNGGYENDSTPITIAPTAKNAEYVKDKLAKLGFEFSVTAYQAPTKDGKAPRAAKAEKGPTFCMFSGKPTKGGKFLPGYDMKLRGALLNVVERATDDETEYAVGIGEGRRKVTRAQAIEELTNVHNWYTLDQINARLAKLNPPEADEDETDDEGEDGDTEE